MEHSISIPVLLTTDLERFYHVNPLYEIADLYEQHDGEVEVKWLAETPFTDDTQVMGDGEMDLDTRTRARVRLLDLAVTRILLRDPATFTTHNAWLFKARYHIEAIVS